MRELAWHLVQATEAAAEAAARYVGRGDKLAADRDATEALRAVLDGIDFAARVVIGEGEKDGAPGLFEGDRVGARSHNEPAYDLAVDPLDGTTQTARGGPEAMSVLALGRAGCLLRTRTYYVRKVVVGPRAGEALDRLTDDWLRLPTGRLIEAVASALGIPVPDVTACVLDRPRHEDLVGELRETGCRVRLCDCDVSSAVATALPGSGIDICLGIGGAPEAVLSAAALRCLGGAVQASLVNPDGSPTDGRLLRTDDLAGGDVLFAATGITDGCLVRGVQTTPLEVSTHSIVLESATKTIRRVETIHPMSRKIASGPVTSGRRR